MNSSKLPFTIFDITLVFILYIILSFVATILLDLTFGFSISEYILLPLSFFIQILILLGLLTLLNRRYSWSKWEDLGLTKYPFWRALGLSILSYLAYLSIMSTILFFTFLYDIDLPGFGEQDLYLPLFGNSMKGVIVLTVVAVLIAPIVEEILFRGFIQGTLEKYISPTLSLLITSVIFSLSHFQFEVVIPLFILGLLLGALRNHTRSISVPIMFHMLNNVITLVVEILFIFTP